MCTFFKLTMHLFPALRVDDFIQMLFVEIEVIALTTAETDRITSKVIKMSIFKLTQA